MHAPSLSGFKEQQIFCHFDLVCIDANLWTKKNDQNNRLFTKISKRWLQMRDDNFYKISHTFTTFDHFDPSVCMQNQMDFTGFLK